VGSTDTFSSDMTRWKLPPGRKSAVIVAAPDGLNHSRIPFWSSQAANTSSIGAAMTLRISSGADLLLVVAAVSTP
jgi:hypothetical protein